jgi:hypothetical protein
MDLGIKAIWYDLPESARDSHLQWLHDSYMPALGSAQGISWAAHYRTVPSRTGDDRVRLNETKEAGIGRGTRFLLLVGAPSVDVFFARAGHYPEPLPSSAEDEARLAERLGSRACIYVEEARVAGPAIGAADIEGTPAAVIQFGSFNTRETDDALELGTYYRQNRFPAMSTSPGCIRTRKLVATYGWARHGILYEFTSLESRRSHFEELVEWGSDPAIARPDNPYRWPGRFPTEYVVFAPGAPTVAIRTWPEVR